MHIIIKEKLKKLCYDKHLKMSAVLEVVKIKRSTLELTCAVKLDKGQFVPMVMLSDWQIKNIEELLGCHRGAFLLNVKLLNNVLDQVGESKDQWSETPDTERE